jgi:hypothetical protein
MSFDQSGKPPGKPPATPNLGSAGPDSEALDGVIKLRDQGHYPMSQGPAGAQAPRSGPFPTADPAAYSPMPQLPSTASLPPTARPTPATESHERLAATAPKAIGRLQWLEQWLWNWPIVGAVALLFVGAGLNAMYGNDYVIAEILFTFGFFLLFVKAMSWSGIDDVEEKYRPQMRIVMVALIAVGLVGFSAWDLARYFHRPPDSPFAITKLSVRPYVAGDQTAVDVFYKTDRDGVRVRGIHKAMLVIPRNGVTLDTNTTDDETWDYFKKITKGEIVTAPYLDIPKGLEPYSTFLGGWILSAENIKSLGTGALMYYVAEFDYKTGIYESCAFTKGTAVPVFMCHDHNGPAH